MRTLEEIKRFYCAKELGQKSLFEKWMAIEPVGKSIVPSIYVPGYRNFIVREIERAILQRKDASIFSIGSGLGLVERELHSRGYHEIICTDVIAESITALSSLGLNATCFDAFELPGIFSNQNFVYLDGVIGHLSQSYKPPFSCCFEKILDRIAQVLTEDGLVMFSDDTPYGENEVEVHPKVPHIRVSDVFFEKELDHAGFQILSMKHYYFIRPGVGRISRRVVLAFLGQMPNTSFQGTRRDKAASRP